MADPTPLPFHIATNDHGTADVVVAGQEVPRVRSVSFDCYIEDGHVVPPTITLEVAPGYLPAVLEGEAIIVVERPTLSGDIVRQLDPAEVERLAFSSADVSSNGTQNFLEAVARLVDAMEAP